MQEIRVPEIADNVTEGKVISITVAVGDTVETDQTLLELETDKAVVAIPSPLDGKIAEIRVSDGDTVKIGAVIMVIESSAGDAGSASAPQREPQEQQAPPSQGEASPATEAPDRLAVRTGDRVAAAAPSIRRLARELGVDIYSVRGTGPGERISEEDVRAAAATSAAGSQLHRPLPDFSKWGTVTTEPLSRVREITADSMGHAWSTIPMVTQYDEADITRLEIFRRDFNGGAPAEAKLTLTAILLKVCAAALRAFPQFNASLDLARKELVLKDYVHIGVAVDTDSGLLVPVIRDVDKKGIEQLALELNETAAKTRERRVNPADLEGGTFTISNLGGIGGTAFSPIVYPPQVAILGVSRASRKPMWDGDGFAPRLMVPLSLSYDHRVIDGADGARFLRWICEAIEQPMHLVMKG
jgi:pyruvate dehydrogenase E2 component (dihydrolipoamide acetyltransferase)